MHYLSIYTCEGSLLDDTVSMYIAHASLDSVNLHV
jgi:hypothetical protein